MLQAGCFTVDRNQISNVDFMEQMMFKNQEYSNSRIPGFQAFSFAGLKDKVSGAVSSVKVQRVLIAGQRR